MTKKIVKNVKKPILRKNISLKKKIHEVIKIVEEDIGDGV